MSIGGRVKDDVLVQRVKRQLAKRGIRPPCRVEVTACKGEVTLSGELQYEHQRKTVLRATREAEGVMRIRDQLKVRPAAAAWLKEKYGSRQSGGSEMLG
ncbi:MAG TPA: BON domain-containing protein [Planctomycetaceae bacterium]|nr:BON domain-containing protein [Planctomycetaceae bacterium]HIQ21975.1 BON domain-containing protein [Planctomycetota bacterium]